MVIVLIERMLNGMGGSGNVPSSPRAPPARPRCSEYDCTCNTESHSAFANKERKHRKHKHRNPLRGRQADVSHVGYSQHVEREAHGKIEQREREQVEPHGPLPSIPVRKERNDKQRKKQEFIESQIMKSQSREFSGSDKPASLYTDRMYARADSLSRLSANGNDVIFPG